MRISIIGYGPAGLYFAILMQKADPGAEIDFYERNRADDTFGFGVVFSDESLDTFEAYAQASYRHHGRRPRFARLHRPPRSTASSQCTARPSISPAKTSW